MAVSSLRICKEILERTDKVSPLKLIKLAYIAHGFYLGYVKEPLFKEDVEAWRYGPVIEDIYLAVNHFKGKAINKDLFDHIDDVLTEDAENVIKAVITTYGKYNGLQLSTLTHRKGSPWDITVQKGGDGAIIPNKLIMQHYEKIIDNGNKSQ